MKPAIKRTLIAGLVCTFVPPFVGLLFTVLGMIGAFHTLGENGITNSTMLSGYVGVTLVATAIGIAFGMVGAVTVLVAVIAHFATRTPQT
jgi:biopolymer transport protein ExbB/TolQ